MDYLEKIIGFVSITLSTQCVDSTKYGQTRIPKFGNDPNNPWYNLKLYTLMKKYKSNFLLSPTTEIFSGTVDHPAGLVSAQYVEYIRYKNVIASQYIPELMSPTGTQLIGTILKYK